MPVTWKIRRSPTGNEFAPLLDAWCAERAWVKKLCRLALDREGSLAHNGDQCRMGI
jgi:hypothetical protein